MNDKIASYLGMAMKAGQCVSGDESVTHSIQSQKARIVIVSYDASENAKSKYKNKCSYYHIPIIEYGTRDELGHCIGKPGRVVVAVTDKGFADAIIKSV